ncbi:MAG: FkbM family methyltransferase [Acidimicrobiia bacterium]|nr:FkbM family methyltransferase [Acidimicrobiia bacterium]
MSTLGSLVDRISRSAAVRFPSGTPVGDALRSIRRRLPRRPPEGALGQVIFAFAREYPRAFVVQVGAHDGSIVDPLRAELVRRPWGGILVEPVPYVFARLQASYGRNSRLVLENSAIADHDGTVDIHHLPETTDGSVWGGYDALGSIRRDVVAKHTDLVPDIGERLVTTTVPSLTFESLCAKHHVDHIDIVQTDTEGYDFEVLKLIDLPRWRPGLIMYEHVHLDPADQDAARSMLASHGYKLIADHMDTIAVHQSALDAHRNLASEWTRIVTQSASAAGGGVSP